MSKSRLQELVQEEYKTLPTFLFYEKSLEKPPHFSASVTFCGLTFYGRGHFSSLKEAANAAADVALETLFPEADAHETLLPKPEPLETLLARPDALDTLLPTSDSHETLMPKPESLETLVARPDALDTLLPTSDSHETLLPKPGEKPMKTDAPAVPRNPLLLNFFMYMLLIVAGIAWWALKRAIDNKFVTGPKSNIQFPMAVMGAAYCLSGLLRVRLRTVENLVSNAPFAIRAWVFTLFAMGLACKEIHLHGRNPKLNSLDGFVIVVSVPELFHSMVIHASLFAINDYFFREKNSANTTAEPIKENTLFPA